MSQVLKVTFIDANGWKLPFNFALGLHIALILGAIYMPNYLRKKPLFPEIYTIDLVNVQIPAPQDTVNKTAPPPVKTKKEVSVSSPIEAAEKVKPVKPVSIKPLKRKKIIKNPQIDETQKKKLEQIHQQRLKEAQEAEKRAEEAAELAAKQALDQLRQMLRTTDNLTPSKKPQEKNTGSQSQSRKNTSVLENQYFASIFNALQPHWKLPEYKIWDADLTAIIVIRISQNGKVTSHFFEQKSGDRLFDKFVLKAIQDGTPLPPIPGALQRKSLEIGLIFKPGSIQY